MNEAQPETDAGPRRSHSRTRMCAVTRAVRMADDNFGFNPLLGSARQKFALRLLANRGGANVRPLNNTDQGVHPGQMGGPGGIRTPDPLRVMQVL